jgi:hypothetical protein
MTKRNDTPNAAKPTGASKQERFLTVQLVPEQRPRIPRIRMVGLWLAQAGFTPETRVKVRVMKGCLVITPE